jgi:hypothetical protein
MTVSALHLYLIHPTPSAATIALEPLPSKTICINMCGTKKEYGLHLCLICIISNIQHCRTKKEAAGLRT